MDVIKLKNKGQCGETHIISDVKYCPVCSRLTNLGYEISPGKYVVACSSKCASRLGVNIHNPKH